MEITSETPDEKIHKLIQLLKATLLMAKNQKLSKAKNKLREMFYIELLTQSFPKLYLFVITIDKSLLFKLLSQPPLK